jgi:DNA-binding IclR family transcriptional regulator
MRSTQLATLRAIQAGADTTRAVATRMLIPLSSVTHRIATLVRDGHVERNASHRLSLTPKALSLLEARARLGGTD